MSDGETYEWGVLPGRSSGAYKRIILCCDGTWQDGLDARQKWKYTNILRLARSVNHVDERFDRPVHQVVFYQSGIGTENLYDKVVLTRRAVNKVEEAYGFVANNYRPGDEVSIFLFGFSRGAYTVRMVAMFIGAIGVLDRTQMDHFASIFLAYQKRGKSEDEEEKRLLDEELEPWTGSSAPGKMRVNVGPAHFSVKVIGVFDTVGSVGMPEELTLTSSKIRNIFGFPDRRLGDHVERAYQALALDETRADFTCAPFEQTQVGRERGQVLKQCWFTGSHCDIGGGFEEHDLSDLTMNWLIANIEDVLSFDYDYVMSLPQPAAPWGAQSPHDPLTGIYKIAKVSRREPPSETNEVTHERIHPSVMAQPNLSPHVRSIVDSNPSILHELLPWECKVKGVWDAKLQSESFRPQALAKHFDSSHNHHDHSSSIIHKAVDKIKHLKDGHDAVDTGDSHHRRVLSAWLQSSIGPVVQELLK
ncbi:hypothetical protein OH76DRAFT_1337360 [Lentinus brumalis]|uniref:T6SS Phospholipase effector Tle1-like catalytic domain-containing protein n=1 Tax=Lentinus brumalis TaxID=2498619 RepID=A0A371DTD8_9APHY|nr:hypothetical protein OH76DRAFT_1337360 [Polyporus brumalis]